MSREVYLSSVVPIGALYSLSLWLSNSAYIYLSVSFIQMLKALMPVAVYSIGVAFKEAFKSEIMANMLSISMGIAIAAYDEAKFDSWGVILQLGAVAFEATRLVLIQILLTSKGYWSFDLLAFCGRKGCISGCVKSSGINLRSKRIYRTKELEEQQAKRLFIEEKCQNKWVEQTVVCFKPPEAYPDAKNQPHVQGFVLLTLSVSVLPLHDRKAIFFIALYIIAVGEGGHKPCVQTFAADQFDENLPEQKKAKSSFFNWWYSGIMVGATSSTLAVVYIEDSVSWAVGFGVLATALAASLAIFLLGIKRYKKQGPFGSPFTSVAQVVAAAARKWRVDVTGRDWGICCGEERVIGAHGGGQPMGRTLAHTDQLRFLDKATIIDNIDASSESRNPWRLCSQNQVEEVKLVVRLIPVWLCSLMFAVVASNFQTYFTKQGSTMIRSIGPHFQLPAASLQALLGVTVMITIPIYDRIFVPITRRFTGHLSGITLLQRIGIGLFLSLLNMAVSGLVEAKRVGVAKQYNLLDNPKATVPMSVWWLLPQYILCGLSDVFTFIGLQELFYDQMPEPMRSLGAAAYVSVVGVGSFISSAVISIVQAISSSFGEEWLGDNLNRAHLDGFYWVLAGLSSLNLCVYVWVAKRFVYKKVEGDDDDDDDDDDG